MQQTKLADKKQYITKCLGWQQIALRDLVDRLHTRLKHGDVWKVQNNSEWLDQCFQVCYGEFNGINKVIYDILDAKDAKQAIAAVKNFHGFSSK